MDKRFEKAISLFNIGNYFESHDVLEELWLETDNEYKDLYQGVIQSAVAFYLSGEHRYKGAYKMFERSKRNLSKYKQIAQGINVRKLISDSTKFFESQSFQSGIYSGSASLEFPKIEYYPDPKFTH